MKPQIAPSMAKRIEFWRLDRLVPFARNARTHSDEQVAQIAASIGRLVSTTRSWWIPTPELSLATGASSRRDELRKGGLRQFRVKLLGPKSETLNDLQLELLAEQEPDTTLDEVEAESHRAPRPTAPPRERELHPGKTAFAGALGATRGSRAVRSRPAGSSLN